MSKPAIVADPAVGGSRVVNILISVLLPAPLGPISPKIDRQRHTIDGGNFTELSCKRQNSDNSVC